MSVSKKLYLAIMAMDSYNRGYGASIFDDRSGQNSLSKRRVGTLPTAPAPQSPPPHDGLIATFSTPSR